MRMISIVAFARCAWFSHLFSRERRGLLDRLGMMGKQDLWGCQGLQGLLGLQERMETR